MLKTYRGSCHCGAVRIEADMDISAGTGKCKLHDLREDAALVGGGEARGFPPDRRRRGVDGLSRRNPVAHHFFCSQCGVRPFERIDAPNMTDETYYNINVACLDGVDIDELVSAPVTYCDGLNNNWGSMPAEVRHL